MLQKPMQSVTGVCKQINGLGSAVDCCAGIDGMVLSAIDLRGSPMIFQTQESIKVVVSYQEDLKERVDFMSLI